MAEISYELLEKLQRANTEIRAEKLEVPSWETAENGGSTYMSDMKERLAKLEGTVGGLARTQEFTLVAVIGVGTILGAFIIGFSIYGLQRFDQLSDKVSELPAKISSDFRDITKTLAESITAAKQQPPQVIIMPAPQQQPTNQK
jgi:outer membrane murein-binding lipoprotein Lpp